MKEKTTFAFNKYIDPIFVITNGLRGFVKEEKVDQYNKDMKLESYEDEKLLRIGMCYKLFNEINKYLSFEQTKKEYKQRMLNLAKEDLSYNDFIKNKKENEYFLNSHAKFLCVKNFYLSEIKIEDSLRILGYYAIIYNKILKIFKNSNDNLKITDFSKTNFYKYIKEVNLEELNIDIKNYSNLTLTQTFNKIFDIVVNSMYELENSTVEPMLVIEKDKDGYDYYNTEDLNINIIEENNFYEKYKKEKEQEVYDWLVREMHTLPDGKIF